MASKKWRRQSKALRRNMPRRTRASTPTPRGASQETSQLLAQLSATDGWAYRRSAFGGLCQWLIQIINIATGNLDKEGGSLFTYPAVDQVPRSGPGGFARHRSRVRGLPEFDRELPAAAMAEEITTPGEGQIKALFTGAGNPVLSTPSGQALDEALPQLDFMVSLDPYINETTRHAHVILPPTSPLEHDHYDMAFHINAVRNTSRYNPPIFEPAEDKLHDWQIFAELGERVARELGQEPKDLVAPHEMMDLSLKHGPYGEGTEYNLSLEKLKENPSGVDLGPLKPMLPERLLTADKRISCATPEALGGPDAPGRDLQR